MSFRFVFSQGFSYHHVFTRPSIPFRTVAPHEILNVVRVTSLEDYRQLTSLLPGWVFRGQQSTKWFLQPSAERVAARGARGWVEVESRALSLFREYNGPDLASKPDSDDYLSWLALVQHYGGPTRLLDFTHSADVAAFFALEDIPTQIAAIWAVNEGIMAAFLQDQLKNPLPGCDLRQRPDRWWFVNRCYGGKFSGYAAIVANPAVDDLRMRAQHGTFLLSLNTDFTLIENVFGMFDLDPLAMQRRAGLGFYNKPFADNVLKTLRKSPIVKIELACNALNGIIELSKVGVDRATLFPGLEGFARSLVHRAIID